MLLAAIADVQRQRGHVSRGVPVALHAFTASGLGSSAVAKTTNATGLLGSLIKAETHMNSLAAVGDLLYSGMDSKNVLVWRDRREFAGFKCGSGLVKAIVFARDGRIHTGHQDKV